MSRVLASEVGPPVGNGVSLAESDSASFPLARFLVFFSVVVLGRLQRCCFHK